MGTSGLRVVTEKRIRDFIEREPRSADAMWRWVDALEGATWRSPGDLKATFASASFVGDLTVSNVGGNELRNDCVSAASQVQAAPDGGISAGAA